MRKVGLVTLMLLCASISNVAWADDFQTQLNAYVTSYQSNIRIKANSQKKLSRAVFKEPLNLNEYQSRLEQIDALSLEHPEAISDLSRFLQRKWETKYLTHYDFTQVQKLDTRNVLAYVGLIAGGLSLFKNPVKSVAKPKRLSRYFRLFKQFLVPVGLTATGYSSGEIYSQYTGDILPLAPAQIISLGVPVLQNDLSELEKSEATRAFLSEAAGISTGWATYAVLNLIWARKAARRAQKLSTPLKRNPWTYVGSFAAGLAVDVGVDWGVNKLLAHTKERELQAELHQAALKLKAASKISKNADAVIEATSNLIQKALKLETYYNLDIYKIIRDFGIHKDEMVKEFGSDPRVFERKSLELKIKTAEEVMAALVPRAYWPSQEYLSFKTRKLIEEVGYEAARENIEKLSPFEQENLVEYIKAYLKHLESISKIKDEKNLKVMAASEILQKEYVKEERKKDHARLAQALLNGDIKRHPEGLLIQVAAFIKSLDQAFIPIYADDLLNRVERPRVFLNAILAAEETKFEAEQDQ